MKVLAKYLNPQAISAVGGFVVNPKGLVEGNVAGAHKSPFHGFSVEFAGHREYMPGDDPKHIDWNVYYKSDKYLIKQYEAETNMTCNILLDISESMRYGSTDLRKMDYASYLAVSLAYLITKARDSMSLAMFDERIVEYLPPSNSMAAVYKINDVIEKSEPTEKTNVALPLMDFAGRVRRRELCIIISDCLCDPEDFTNGLARLRYDHHEIVLFHINDPMELDFNLEGHIKFKGMEGWDELKLHPRQVRQAYLKKVEEHQYKLREACEKAGAEYVLVNTGRPIQELLFGYLTSRLSHLVR